MTETTFTNYPPRKCNICGAETKPSLENFIGWQKGLDTELYAMFQCDTDGCDNTLCLKEVKDDTQTN